MTRKDLAPSQQSEAHEKVAEAHPRSEPLAWLEEHGDYLFRFAMQRVHNRETAEDLVQDALLSAYKAFDSFEGKAAVKTWLVSILRNKIIDHMRRVNRVQFVSLEGMTDGNTADDSFSRLGIWRRILPAWNMNPDAVLENKDFFAALQNCVSVLPESMSAVFSLRILEQMSTKEICDTLDISENNVWVILHRARMKVRDCIEVNWLSTTEKKG